jgi:tRNA/tmRNA/rRNA uracil-C5-methylase (TrmA/RlmC/RlmD family)
VGYLRHLLVRRTRSGEILVGLVTTGTDGKVRIQDKEEASDTGVNMDVDENELIKGYTDSILGLKNDGTISGSIQGIIHIINDSVADAVKADRVDVLYGQDFITEELLGLKFKITPFSFFQTNTYGAELLYSKVREYAASVMGDGDETIYDLYSGTGTIAQILAGSDYFGNDDEKEGSYKGKDLTDENRQHKRKVIGVEIVEEAVEAARVNAKENGLDNCTFIAGDVLKVLDDLKEKPDLIILDPPREGIHPKALPKIISYGVDNIIYVSCKTTSLARDLEVFLQAGYVVRRICPVDQFPRTGNIEVVVSLGKNFEKPKDYIQVGIDAEDYYRIKNSDKEE